jgi:hypothetical protein
VPAAPALLAAALLAVYLFRGGHAPRVGDVALFQLQEVFCLLYVTMFEGSIRIGLIPSNSGYDELFRISDANASIVDQEGQVIYRSRGTGPVRDSGSLRTRTQAIRGGHIFWTEDRSAIAGLNRELQVAAQRIEEENDLIQQENAVRAERLRYETKNRLYDTIARAVRPQVLAMDEFFRSPPPDEDAFRTGLMHAALLGAYVKRRGNLMLLADESPSIAAGELVLAVRESLEYLALRCPFCHVQEEGTGACLLPSALVILAYDLFEAVAESVWAEGRACVVSVRCAGGFAMEVQAAADACPVTDQWRRAELEALGTAVSVRREDDTLTVRLTAGEGARP